MEAAKTSQKKFLSDKVKYFIADIMEQFSLPLRAWNSSREIIASILVSSLLINLLSLVFPMTLLQIYDRIIPNQSTNTLFWLTFTVFVSIIIAAVLQVTRTYIGAWADAKFEHIVGCNAYKNLMKCRINEYEKEGSGRHLKRISALSTLKNFYSGQLITSVVDLPFIVIFLLLIAYIGSWIVLVPIFVIIVLSYLVIKNSSAIQNLLRTRQDHDEKRLNFIVETVSKIHTVKSNSMEAQMMRRYENFQRKSALFDYFMNQRTAFLSSDSMIFSQITIAMVVAFGSMMVFNGYMTLGTLAACTLLSGRCLQPINILLNIWARMQSIKVAREELDKILNMRLESKEGLPKISNIKGEIDIQNISFKYEEASPKLFDNFSLKIHHNECISINGEGFLGKSTLMYFIMGLMRPSKGKILIDGQNIFSYNLENFRENIGYMSGNATLFKGTILENLTMFNKHFEENAIESVRKLGLIDVIEHLPDGFDTKIGYQSSEILSRGAIQRLTMARAITRNPKIILFDEANITLDRNSTEKTINFLKEIIGKHTIIIVSHSSSFLDLGQKKYRFSNGKVEVIE